MVCAAQVAPSAGAIIGIGKLSDMTWPRKGTSPVSTFVQLFAGGSRIRTIGPLSYDQYPNGLKKAPELCAHGQPSAHP